MADLHNLASYRSGKARLSASAVAQALATLGGAAHRDLIVDVLLASVRPAMAKATLACEVDRVLRENAGERSMFSQPFGPESRRWVLRRPATPDRSAAPRVRGPVVVE